MEKIGGKISEKIGGKIGGKISGKTELQNVRDIGDISV